MNRRDFLQTGVIAGAGAILTRPGTLKAQGASTTDDLNLAVIGAGTQGRVLISAAVKIPRLRFRAVCDIWEYSRGYARRYLKKRGHEVNTYVDCRDMLAKEKDLDAAIVATPDFVHAEHTNACLAAGMHVYCEKMMSNTPDAARSMVAAMKKTGKLLQIGHQRRSNPRYLHAWDRIVRPGKMLGRLTHANAQWNRAVGGDLGWPRKYQIDAATLKRYGYGSMREFRNWRWFRKYGGGPICDLGAHQIDIFNWFFACPPKSVLAAGGRDYYKDREWYDNVTAVYEYETPRGLARALYQVLTTTSAGGGYTETFMGTQGALKISENPRWTRVYREAHAEDWTPWVKQGIVRSLVRPETKPAGTVVDVRETADVGAYELPVELSKPIHQPHLENFFDAVRGKGKLSCPADLAFKSEAAVFKVNEAVEAERKLPFKPDDFLACSLQ